MRSRQLLTILFAVLVIAAGCSPESDVADDPSPVVTASSGSLEANDQSSDGSKLVVAKVDIDGSSGFIAVHKDLNGKPGEVVGHAKIPEGESSDVVVTLGAKQESGKFWPMLHLDNGVLGTYEFPKQGDATIDAPVTANGAVVMKQITLTVQ